MSLRDEMNTVILDAWSFGVGVDVLADRLMPLVERAVRESINLYKQSGMLACEEGCKSCAPAIDAIVARVTGKGDL